MAFCLVLLPFLVVSLVELLDFSGWIRQATMLFSTPIISFVATALLATANASFEPVHVGGGLQEVLDDRPIMVTLHSTRYTTVTKTTTIPEGTSVPQSSVQEPAVQTSLGWQKKHMCDRSACESCRFWYRCKGGEPSWYVLCASSPPVVRC